MAALATTDDVAARWRPLTSAEEEVAETLLEDASLIIRARVSDLDTRIDAGTLDSALATMVAASMVVRAMKNPGGAESRTVSIDDYTSTERYAEAAREGLLVTDAELSLLLASDAVRGAFTIRPTWVDPSTDAAVDYIVPTSTLDRWTTTTLP